jgi:hypothetical protein
MEAPKDILGLNILKNLVDPKEWVIEELIY